MDLTNENYFSAEAERSYWSASQVKSFLSCEARAKAELDGTWTRPSSTALLVGSYLDCILTEPERFRLFQSEHPELFKRDGTLKAEFAQAEAMAERVKSDDVMMRYLNGDHQTVVTGELFGLPFKCKFDAYKKGEFITDLKSVKDFEPLYKPGEGRLSPMEYWNWDLQLAIYSAVEGNGLPTYLAMVTKQNPPDIQLVEIESHRREALLEYLKEKLPRLDAVKRGIIEPTRCENCEYCRATRKITEPIALDAWVSERME